MSKDDCGIINPDRIKSPIMFDELTCCSYRIIMLVHTVLTAHHHMNAAVIVAIPPGGHTSCTAGKKGTNHPNCAGT
ncbi:MAG TPA: hypothetical protein VH796_12835 [Nitrososphaeraceae archaeon]|jgi:hypothetical protein